MLSTDLAASPDDQVLPDFSGRSILNLVTSLTAQLGLPPTSPHFSAPLPLDGVERVVLVVVDGLGHFLLDRHLERGQMPWLAGQLTARDSGWTSATATSTLPSSTMIALTTLHTGVPPALHGWLGTTVYHGDTVADLLFQTDVVAGTPLPDPDALMVVPSVYRRLADVGVSSGYVNPAAYAGTFLDRFYFGAGTAYRYGPDAGLPAQVAQAASENRYVMAYWPNYDTTNHTHGPSSPESARAAGEVDALLRQTVERLPRGGRTVLVITADHGQRDTPRPSASVLTGPPPAGENRVRYFRDELPGLPPGVTVVSSAELWAQGVFGGPAARPEYLARTGTYTAVVQHAAQLSYDYGAGPRLWKGCHGGWSAEEMVVPVLTLRV